MTSQCAIVTNGIRHAERGILSIAWSRQACFVLAGPVQPAFLLSQVTVFWATTAALRPCGESDDCSDRGSVNYRPGPL